eukprot:2407977-Amphidinium_carterae.2
MSFTPLIQRAPPPPPPPPPPPLATQRSIHRADLLLQSIGKPEIVMDAKLHSSAASTLPTSTAYCTNSKSESKPPQPHLANTSGPRAHQWGGQLK